MKKVSIIGLGWLGMPLALALNQRGWQVQGTKTTDDGILTARRCQIDATKLIASPNLECDVEELEQLMTADVVVITLPASHSYPQGEHYVQSVQNIVDSALAYGVKRVIFTSSTSVYGEQQGEVSELTPVQPVTATAKRLVELEQWLHELPGLEVDILRLAGLVGPDRHPGRFLAGKQGVKQGNHRVNLVHLDDVVSVITLLLTGTARQRVFNLAAPQHPRRDEFYPQVAKQLGLVPPSFTRENTDGDGKLVNGQAICSQLGFTYQYPDPFTMPVG